MKLYFNFSQYFGNGSLNLQISSYKAYIAIRVTQYILKNNIYIQDKMGWMLRRRWRREVRLCFDLHWVTNLRFLLEVLLFDVLAAGWWYFLDVGFGDECLAGGVWVGGWLDSDWVDGRLIGWAGWNPGSRIGECLIFGPSPRHVIPPNVGGAFCAHVAFLTFYTKTPMKIYLHPKNRAPSLADTDISKDFLAHPPLRWLSFFGGAKETPKSQIRDPIATLPSSFTITYPANHPLYSLK